MDSFIHISDLHLPPLPQVAWRQLLNKRFIGYLNWRFNRQSAMAAGAFPALLKHMAKQNYQHLAISGDMVNLALPAEFRAARAKLAALGAAENISLVLGNHDAYVPGAFAKACAAFVPWIKGDNAAAAGQAAFPFMRARGKIAFIGASSAIATPPFLANGYFGAEQAAALAALLRQAGEQGLFRVVMIHHPPLRRAAPWHKKLWGIKRFQTALALSGAELVLHGHTHLPSLSYIRGQAGKPRIPVVGVAAAGQEFGRHKPAAGYNLFSVSQTKRGEWQCGLRRFGILAADNKIGCFAEKDLLTLKSEK